MLTKYLLKSDWRLPAWMNQNSFLLPLRHAHQEPSWVPEVKKCGVQNLLTLSLKTTIRFVTGSGSEEKRSDLDLYLVHWSNFPMTENMGSESGLLEAPFLQGCRSRPFWLEPDPFLWSGSYSYSYSYSCFYSYSTVNILFLRDPKYEL